MNEVFLDTSFAVALTVTTDRYHQTALQLAKAFQESHRSLVTTQAILAEIGDSFSRPPFRHAATALLSSLQRDPTIAVVPIDDDLFARGFDLFAQRSDKTWGLTDCISFALMSERGMTDALTADRHFQQAGFRALLRDGAA